MGASTLMFSKTIIPITVWAAMFMLTLRAREMQVPPMAPSKAPVDLMMEMPPAGTVPAPTLNRGRRIPQSFGSQHFTENRGQWPIAARFIADLPGLMIGVETNAICLMPGSWANGQAGSECVRLVFEGSSPTAWIEGVDAGPTLYHYYLGSDPSGWVTNVLAYRALLIHDLYPGVSLRATTSEATGFKYDIVIEPYADLSRVVVRCEGIQDLHVGLDGELLLKTVRGDVVQPFPPTWVERGDGTHLEQQCCYRIVCERTFGFELTTSQAIEGQVTIDPGIVWASYLGCSNDSTGDVAFGVATEPNGRVTAVGRSGINFPTTPGAFASPSNSLNTFVTKFESNGSSPVYSAVIGGTSNFDYAMAVDVDSLGQACVVGFTLSPDFPTTAGSFRPTHTTGGAPSYALKLSAAGDHLIYSTFLSDSYGTTAYKVRSTQSGSVIVVGETDRHGFPTTPGVIEPTVSGLGGGFVTRLDPTGSNLEWSTFFGDGAVRIFGVDVDSNGDVLIAGDSFDGALPGVAGAFQSTCRSCTSGFADAFVSRLRADAQEVLWTTYLGGSFQDTASSVSCAPDGGAIVVGTTSSTDFPSTPNSVQPNAQGGFSQGVPNGFVTWVGAGGANLVYSTYLGWQSEAFLTGRVDHSGIVSVVGKIGIDFPITPGSISGNHLGEDFAVIRLDPLGERVLYSTFLGGTGTDWPSAIDLLPNGRIVVAGRSTGAFPTTPGAYQSQYAGGQTDAVVAVLDLQPTGIRPFGEGQRACQGTLYQIVSAMPAVGSQRFGVICGQAPPNADGLLIVGSAAIGSPQVHFGAQIWIDLAQPFVRLPVHANPFGYAEVALPIPPSTQGIKYFTQFLFRAPSTCAASTQLVSSNALEIVIQ